MAIKYSTLRGVNSSSQKMNELKWTSLIHLFIVVGHLYLSGMWIRCNFKNKYQKDMCLKEIELHA